MSILHLLMVILLALVVSIVFISLLNLVLCFGKSLQARRNEIIEHRECVSSQFGKY